MLVKGVAAGWARVTPDVQQLWSMRCKERLVTLDLDLNLATVNVTHYGRMHPAGRQQASGWHTKVRVAWAALPDDLVVVAVWGWRSSVVLPEGGIPSNDEAAAASWAMLLRKAPAQPGCAAPQNSWPY